MANKPKLFIVSQEYKADYKVCFTEHEYKADILITRKHFPK